eukprot:scaffold399457_cov35-Prasinocladus_malaysianus.AAC.1
MGDHQLYIDETNGQSMHYEMKKYLLLSTMSEKSTMGICMGRRKLSGLIASVPAHDLLVTSKQPMINSSVFAKHALAG